MAKDKNIGQQSNENWDDQNDQRSSSSTPSQPNPERFQDANLGQGSGSVNEENNRSTDSSRSDESRSDDKSATEHTKHGSAFNERQESTEGYGSSQRDEPRQNVGPMDADLEELPSKKRSGNQTGPGLG